MRLSVFLDNYKDILVTKWIIPALKGNHEVVKQDRCICELATQPTREELGDLVFVHPHDSNEFGCYDSISKFVEQYPDVPFYICALQDSSKWNQEFQV